MNGRISGRLRNFDFQEEFEHGRMHFDYKLREGVVTKSNGLELMRSIGRLAERHGPFDGLIATAEAAVGH